MAFFPRCNNPVSVVGRHGLTLVGCHSCIQCRVAAQEHLCKLLEVEASKHKYVEFITNTYDDMHLPYIDTSYLYPFGYALRIPNRVIKKYNRRTKEFYYVEDKISKSFHLVDFGTIDTAPMLRDYYSRIDKYYNRFPNRSRGIRNNSVIPILWYDDIRKYIARLRKWFLKKYGEKFATTLFVSTAHNHSVRIIISYYSTIRLERERILEMFGFYPCQHPTIQEKFVVNSIWLRYGSTVIRLQRLQMEICKSMLVSILHNILTSLECLTSFHKGRFTQSYWEQKTKQRLKNYSRLEISKHCQQIMLLTKKVFDALFPCPLRITLNCPSDLQALPSIMLTQLVPCFVQFYTAHADSSVRPEKSIMTQV